MGRRKIEIQPLTDDRNRTVTFVKRKAGLFKKAHELAVLCQVDLAVIIVGSNKKIYEFSSVDTKELLDCYHRAKPHEQKLPESYGNYKKKAHLHDRFTLKDDIHDVVDDTNAPSDYESDTPEPKRKKPLLPLLIYSTKQKAVNSRFAHLAQTAAPEMDHMDQMMQRPVLRVQIPQDVKASTDSAQTITALDTEKKDKPENVPPAIPRYGFKFKSPENKKVVPQLPLPKLQTLSPSSATAPPLPSGMPFYTLPQPSPSAQYPPGQLPVFNQVFNQQYSQAHPSAPGNHGNTNENDEAPKFKPFQQFEQTPMSALPSRYINDFFPSPSTLYPGQEWPTGTPYASNMPHYFVSMVPTGNGATPMPMNMYNRTSLLGGGQRQVFPTQPPPPQNLGSPLQQQLNLQQGQGELYMGQFAGSSGSSGNFKK